MRHHARHLILLQLDVDTCVPAQPQYQSSCFCSSSPLRFAQSHRLIGNIGSSLGMICTSDRAAKLMHQKFRCQSLLADLHIYANTCIFMPGGGFLCKPIESVGQSSRSNADRYRGCGSQQHILQPRPCLFAVYERGTWGPRKGSGNAIALLRGKLHENAPASIFMQISTGCLTLIA